MYRKKRAILLAGMFCIFFFANVYIIPHKKIVRDLHTYDPMESIPILVLGGFRGIAIDLLWARAISRHQEKKYYELLTINNLISKLQPEFPAVWIFQAWNMAYNIAHDWDAPQNKWKWIRAGLEFAKRGAKKNPESGDLCFELGHMYMHLFNERFFKYAPYFRAQLKKETGEDNYEVALYWLRRSLENNPKRHNTSAIERTICHTLWYASLCAEKEGDITRALEYTESAIREWQIYSTNHPDESVVNVKRFIKDLEEKKEILQNLSLPKGDDWK